MATVRERVRQYMDTHGPVRNIDVANALGLPGADTWRSFNEYRNELLSSVSNRPAAQPAETLPMVRPEAPDGGPGPSPLSGESVLSWAYVVRAPNGQWCRLVPLEDE